MRYRCCPEHPGRIIENHPCPICGHPKAKVEGRETYHHDWTLQSHKQEDVPVLAAIPNAQVEPQSYDSTTGEVYTQPTLSEALFPAVTRRDVPRVRLTVSGTVEMYMDEFAALCDYDGSLRPGHEVTMEVHGYLPAPHSAWVKRKAGTGRDQEVWFENEGRIGIKIMSVSAVTVGGVWHE